MKLHPSLVAVAALLALAACRPAPAEYTEAEAPKRLALDSASARIDVRFAAGSTRLLPADAARLRALVASGSVAPSDRVTVSAGGGPSLAAERVRAIAAELVGSGILVTAGPTVPLARDVAIIDARRYLVTMPLCPNWSKQPALGFENALSSNFGCASAVNLGLMVASPVDLVEGRPVGFADALPAAAAIQRYQTDKVQLPVAATVGPIATPTSQTPGAAGGGASAGSTP